jgi:uncharacterized protein with von Willebrand factor type A (vWA) domain
MEMFVRLRRGGLALGVGELLAALRMVEGGWGAGGLDDLRDVARLLWCHSAGESTAFDAAWAASTPLANASPRPAPVPLPQTAAPRLAPEQPAASSSAGHQGWPVNDHLGAGQTWTALPVRAPREPIPGDDTSVLQTYWPVSRRFMVYIWRYLRRPVPDGPQDLLDVVATVAHVAHEGVYLAPIYRRRERNHAHLALFVDQGGSMVPVHRFTRDVVDTARHDSDIGQVDIFYFHNVLTANVYSDPYMTELVPLDRILEAWSPDTSVLVVSDAGAARGYRNLERVRATAEFLIGLKHRTNLVAWLNPMPDRRWTGSSAAIVAHMVPMFQMDPDGFSNAIDVIRGQPLKREH